MKSPEETLKAQRALSAKKASGVLVIVATLLMVGSGAAALRNDESTSEAMKVPFTLVMILSLLFVRSDKKALQLQLMLKDEKKRAEL
jgi:hypothetical protein